MKVVRTIPELRHVLAPAHATRSVGLVPTMGALHDGHAALIRAASVECETVVVSVFVDTAQFADSSDLEAHPRDEAGDLEKAAAAGGHWLFAPAVEDICPAGCVTTVDVQGPAEGFEGAVLPGRFRSAATAAAKLFNIVQPQAAYFGQKDAQQAAVMRRLVRDLDFDLTIRVVPTVRDEDGLAVSSRNARLTAAERARALGIPRALKAALAAHGAGADALAAARAELSGLDLDYVDVATFDGEPTLVVAVRIAGTRLIDNLPLDRPQLAGM